MFCFAKSASLAASRLAPPNGWDRVYPMDLTLSTRPGTAQTTAVSVLLPLPLIAPYDPFDPASLDLSESWSAALVAADEALDELASASNP